MPAHAPVDSPKLSFRPEAGVSTTLARCDLPSGIAENPAKQAGPPGQVAMFDAQTWSIFTETIADPRFALAVGIAALSGLVRGFSGFGSALIYMPLSSAVYSPRLAAPTLLLIDTLCSLPFALQAMPQCNWREVTPVTIAGSVVLPLGVAALLYVDPLWLRWLISLLVLAALAALATGWRYHGKPTLAASPASAPARCKSAYRRCWSIGWVGKTARSPCAPTSWCISSCRAHCR
jgi:hypothetical protein